MTELNGCEPRKVKVLGKLAFSEFVMFPLKDLPLFRSATLPAFLNTLVAGSAPK